MTKEEHLTLVRRAWRAEMRSRDPTREQRLAALRRACIRGDVATVRAILNAL